MREISTRRYQRVYQDYNHGKTGNVARRNRTLGAKKTRNKLKQETHQLLTEYLDTQSASSSL